MIKQTWRVILLIFFITLIFFIDVIAKREVLYCCDNLLISLPAKLFFQKEMLSGHFPLWYPYVFSGTPYLADINLSPLYPGQFIDLILYQLVNPLIAMTFMTEVHITIAFIGMYWCAKSLEMSKKSALFSGMIYAFSGTMMGYTGNIPMLQVAAFLPWTFGAWIKFGRTGKKKFLFISILFAVIQLFAGHPQLTFYSWILYGLYTLWCFPYSIQKKATYLFIFGICTFLLSSIQLIPFIEFARLSTRDANWTYATFGSFPPWAIIRLLFPSITGSINQGTAWWQGGSVYGYTGIIALTASMYAINKARIRMFFVVMGIVSLLASLGEYSPVYFLFYKFIPGVGLFRVPSHFLLLTTVSVSILAGWGLEEKKYYKFIKWVGVGCILIFFLLFVWSYYSSSIFVFLQSFSRLKNKLNYLGINGLEYLIKNLSINTLLIGLGLLFFSQRKRNIFLVFTIAFIELFIYAKSGLIVMPFNIASTYFDKAKSSMQSLTISPDYRLWIHPDLYASHLSSQFGIPSYPKEIDWQTKTGRPNLPVFSKIRLVDGYGAIIYKNYQESFNERSKDPTGINIGSITNKRLYDLSARYLLLPTEKKNWSQTLSNDMEKDIYTSINNNQFVTLFENKQIPPRIRLEYPDGRIQSVSNIKEEIGKITITVETEENTKLVISENAYPGWNVTLNNLSTNLVDYKGLLATDLKIGTNVVVFQYLPHSFFVGIVFSLIGLLLVIYLMVHYKKINQVI